MIATHSPSVDVRHSAFVGLSSVDPWVGICFGASLLGGRDAVGLRVWLGDAPSGLFKRRYSARRFETLSAVPSRHKFGLAKRCPFYNKPADARRQLSFNFSDRGYRYQCPIPAIPGMEMGRGVVSEVYGYDDAVETAYLRHFDFALSVSVRASLLRRICR